MYTNNNSISVYVCACACVCKLFYSVLLPHRSFYLTFWSLKISHIYILIFFHVMSCVHPNWVILTRCHVAWSQRTWYNVINNNLFKSGFLFNPLATAFSRRLFLSHGTKKSYLNRHQMLFRIQTSHEITIIDWFTYHSRQYNDPRF